MKKGDATRQRILDEVISLTETEGAHAVSIRKVATKANLTPMAIYRHFPDKAHLEEALLFEAFSIFEIYLERTLGNFAPLDQLKRLAHGFIKFALEKPKHFELLFLSAANPRNTLDPKTIRTASAPTFKMLQQAIEDCLTTENLPPEDLHDLTLDVLAFCIGHASLHISKNINVSKKASLRHFEEAFNRFVSRIQSF